MNFPQKRPANRRRSGPHHASRNILHVNVRSKAIIQQRARFFLAWGCRLFLAGALVVGCVYGVRQGLRKFLWENSEYNLAVVEINKDGQGLSRDVILSTAGLRLGQNVFSFSLAKARDAVAALPQVDHVEMQRVLPNKVSIDLSERRPVAWVADAQTEDPSATEKAFLVDAKRVLFKPKQRLEEYLRLPAICGVPTENFLAGETISTPEVRAALDLIQRNGDTDRFKIQNIDISKGYCMIATDTKRARVTFGLDKIDQQLDRLGAVLDHFSGTHQEIQTVNLMVERNIPVTFAPPLAQPELSASGGAPAVAENAVGATLPRAERAKAGDEENVKHAAKSPVSSKKKSSAPAESHERKKAPKRTKASEGETDTPKRINRSEPTVRRALPAQPAPAPPSSSVNTSHSIFSLFHGQR